MGKACSVSTSHNAKKGQKKQGALQVYKVTRIRPQSSSSTVGLLKKKNKNVIESLTVAPQKVTLKKPLETRGKKGF